jgi:Asp-tRNA(Asn)/Glu-tRNA(Gln) amidotransferase A subunit family amidase
MKPTYGLVSNRGVIPLAASLDHVGPLTRSVGDCALTLDAIAGYDARDLSSVEHNLEAAPALDNLRGIRIGIPRRFFFEGLEPEVRAAIEAAIEVLAGLGAEIGNTDLEVSADRIVFRAEAFAAHARYIASAPHLYQPETLAKLKLGANIDAPTYIEALQRLREQRRGMDSIFSSIDVLVTPTAPVIAPRIDDYPQRFEDVLELEAARVLRNTRPFNIYGIPALTVPCGETAAGLPVGLHIAAAPWHDRFALRVAQLFESTRRSRVPTFVGDT